MGRRVRGAGDHNNAEEDEWHAHASHPTSGIGGQGSGIGHVRHEEHGLRFAYMPTVPRHTARKSALNHLVDTFFDSSHAKVVTTLLGSDASRLSDADLDRIAELIATARKTGRWT